MDKLSKALRVTSSRIVVSANSLSETGYNIFHRIEGILPGCRKVATLHFTPMTGGYIWVTNLHSHNGYAHIDPIEWRHLVNDTQVASCDLSPYPITPEIEKVAKEDALYITVCPAITDRSSKYEPEFHELLYIR